MAELAATDPLRTDLVEDAERCEAGHFQQEEAAERGGSHRAAVLARRVAAAAVLLGTLVVLAVFAVAPRSVPSTATDFVVPRPMPLMAGDISLSVKLYDEAHDELIDQVAGLVNVPIPPIIEQKPVEGGNPQAGSAGSPSSGAKEVVVDEHTCRENEEFFLGLCYKKCSILTNGDMTIRSAPTACCRKQPCFLPNNIESKSFVDLVPCSGFMISGDGKCPRSPGECDGNEEKFLGNCYKMCSLLTSSVYPKRVGPNTCCKGTNCWDFFNLKTEGGICSGFAVGGGGPGHDCPHSGS